MDGAATPEGCSHVFSVRGPCPRGYSAEQYAEAWVEASERIQRAAGARGTRLHRKIGDANTLLAIASWESKTARDAMEGAHDPEVARIIAEQARYCDIRLIGEFEDAEWRVEPRDVDAAHY